MVQAKHVAHFVSQSTPVQQILRHWNAADICGYDVRGECRDNDPPEQIPVSLSTCRSRGLSAQAEPPATPPF